MKQQLETELLTAEAQKFLRFLDDRFSESRRKLLEARQDRWKKLRNGQQFHFLPETQALRDGAWTVAKTPPDLLDRRVEITGPAESKMMINALNSGASAFMADLEDALSPTWENILRGHSALNQAVQKTLTFQNEAGKVYSLNSQTATLIVRPRGLHLLESHFLIEDLQPISASLFDFGLYFFHNAKILIQQGRTPAFYLPKMESHLEARWWNEVFIEAQSYFEIPRGTIRATVLIETLPAAFEMDEILFELMEHAAGLNAGRWDYIFSIIKKEGMNPAFILPDRSQITMETPFMSAYARLLVKTCHRRNAHAMGGMAAFIPNRRLPEVTRLALEKVTQDKAREARLGFDGSWVAHPDLVEVAKKEFDQVLQNEPHQKHKIIADSISETQLLDVRIANGKITEEGVRLNISVCLQYIERWLAGVGAVAIHNLMEDAATAEISRGQLWQWRHHSVRLDDGRMFTRELYLAWRAEEMKKLEADHAAPHLERAMSLLDQLVLREEFTEFLTVQASTALNWPEKLFVNWSLPQMSTQQTHSGVW